MKKLMTLGIILFLAVVNYAYSEKSTNYIVSLIVGEVKISHNSGHSWNLAEPSMILREQDTIRTGTESYCDILMPGRGNFRIADNTVVMIQKLRQQVEQIKVRRGKAFFNIAQHLEKDETFEVQTEVASAAVRGTEFIIDTDGESNTVSVQKGKVAIMRNIEIPEDSGITPEEAQKYLEVEATDNHEITMTMSENKALENTLKSAKNNLQKVKALRNSQNATKMKIKMMRERIDRVFDELNKASDNLSNGASSEDETESVIDKIKSKEK